MLSPMISDETSKRQRSAILKAYVGFAAISAMVYQGIGQGEFSAILTLSALFQLLAFTLLGIQVLSTENVLGISAKSLQLEAVALACRLSSTTWLSGYLPSDPTGDIVYQAFDIFSLVLVLWLLYQVSQHQTYEADEDTVHAAPFVMCSLVLAILLHGDLDDIALFDASWMCGLFVSSVAVVPWLKMLMKIGGSNVPTMTSHVIAVMAFSRTLSTSYMWYAYPEITHSQPWFGSFNHTGYAVITAHVLHLMLLGTFAYYYLATKSIVDIKNAKPLFLEIEI